MPAPRLTTDEYFRMPESLIPEELVYGVVRNAPAPTPGHQWAVGRLFIALAVHVEKRYLGRVWPAPIDVVLDREKDLVVQPDIVFVSHERHRMVTDRIWGAPDLVIEVLSPKPRLGQLGERLRWFAEYGVRECWVVHQAARELEVLTFAGADVEERRTFSGSEPIASTVLPDLRSTIDELLR
jgi:Uma2 family endonuclease